MNKLFLCLNIVAWVSLFFSYISPVVAPSTTWFFSLFGLFFPYIILANLMFVSFWFFVKKKYAWIGLVFLLLGYSPINKLIKIAGTDDIKEASFSLMSYNVHSLKDLANKDKNKSKKNYDAFAKFINQKKKEIDIFCFQEQHGYKSQKLIDLFDDFDANASIHRGTSVFSRYPMIDSGNFKLESYAHQVAWVDIAIRKDTIRVYSVHLSSNRVSIDADKVIEEHKLSERKTWSNIKKIFKRYAHHSRLREKQAKAILDHAKLCPYPVIIAGDFNDVTQSFLYHKMTDRLEDTFVQAGRGIGATYRYTLPALRIDYFFVDPAFDVLSHEVPKTNFSDHNPILTSISLAN